MTTIDNTPYKDFVKSLSRRSDDRLFLNSDEEHALIVLTELFQRAKKEVRIFAGCLCKRVGDNPEYIIALSEFIERGGKVKILLNSFDEDLAKSSNLYRRLSYYRVHGKPVEVKKTYAKAYVSGVQDRKEAHFTVCDGESYRVETDIEKRAAECTFNNPAMAKELENFFDSLFRRADAIDVDLKSLFS